MTIYCTDTVPSYEAAVSGGTRQRIIGNVDKKVTRLDHPSTNWLRSAECSADTSRIQTYGRVKCRTRNFHRQSIGWGGRVGWNPVCHKLKRCGLLSMLNMELWRVLRHGHIQWKMNSICHFCREGVIFGAYICHFFVRCRIS